MTAIDRTRLLELSARIGCSPRDLVLAAARMTLQPERTPDDVIDDLRRPLVADPAADAIVNLLLTPASSYAVGHVEDIFAACWDGLDPRLR